MLDRTVFKALKQTNISKNGAKTKERLHEAWKLLNKEKRSEALELCGLTKFAVRRSIDESRISLKLAAAISQVANIDPRYLSGESDESRALTDKVLYDFLVKNGYKDPNKAKHKKGSVKLSKKQSAAVAEPIIEIIQTENDYEKLIEPLKRNNKSSFDNMSEEEILLLLKALFTRAKYNEEAAFFADCVKRIISI